MLSCIFAFINPCCSDYISVSYLSNTHILTHHDSCFNTPKLEIVNTRWSLQFWNVMYYSSAWSVTRAMYNTGIVIHVSTSTYLTTNAILIIVFWSDVRGGRIDFRSHFPNGENDYSCTYNGNTCICLLFCTY